VKQIELVQGKHENHRHMHDVPSLASRQQLRDCKAGRSR